MSVKATTAVFERSKSKGSARLVLLALADVASDEGEVTAYKRSASVLAAKANVDTSTVTRAIDSLVALGELERLVVGTGRTKSDYRIVLPGLGEPPQIADPAPAGSPPQPPQDAGPITTSFDVPGPSTTAPAPSEPPARKPPSPKAPRARDPLWDALQIAWLGRGSIERKLTKNESGRIAAAKAQLVAIGATPEQVAVVADRMRRQWGNAGQVTPTSIASNWHTFVPAPSETVDPTGAVETPAVLW